MKTALIIHGHFYQPPRENPWTETVEREPSAAPFHDWNERIHQECYRANAFTRVTDQFGRVEVIVNNYENLSFNFGPTLLSWLERHHPETYERIIEADRASVARHGGHGNAIAQGYNHAILPLCNERDRRTQLRWGIEDFKHRFGRDPESLWLPETACDDRTLGALIDEGIKYVILSPYQAERVRPIGGTEWINVSDGTVDSSVPYLYYHRDGSGRSLAIFFYQGEIARAIAFEGGLASSRALVDRFTHAASGEGRVVNVATDGESYGHHYRLGDRCLAYALEVEAPARGFWVTNYGEFLEKFPPEFEAEIKLGPHGEGTAWSCFHGVSRWSRDCGCQGGGREGWNQSWRGPLRLALDLLRDEAALYFAEAEGDLFLDPWAARDDYIRLIVNPQQSREEFLYRHAGRILSAREKERALSLLEMQRHAMLMYTSCGWFFSDISGIETVQDLKYAGRVLDLMDELGLASPRERFLETLAAAQSNLPEMGDGAEVFRRLAEPSRVLPPSVATSLAISSLVEAGSDTGAAAGYRFRRENFRQKQHGRIRLATGRLWLEATATGRQYDYALAAMHFGGIDFYCVLQPYPGDEPFAEAARALWSHFHTATLPTIIRLAQENFGTNEFGLEHVLSETREQISATVFGDLLKRFADEYAALYRENRRRIEMLRKVGFELPVELRTAAEFTLGRRFEEEIRKQQQSQNPASYQKAIRIANEAARHGYKLDRTTSRRVFEEMIFGAVRDALNHDAPAVRSREAVTLLGLARKLGIEPNLDRAQELVYGALWEGELRREEAAELLPALNFAPDIMKRVRQLAPPEEVSLGSGGAALA